MIRFAHPPVYPRQPKRLIKLDSGVPQNPTPSTARGLRRALKRQQGKTLPSAA